MLASNSAKGAAEKFLGQSFIFYRLAYNIFSLVFLFLILYILLQKHEMNFVFSPAKFLSNAGVFLLASGVLIIMLAFANYDLGEFTGIKQLANQIHHPEKLVVKGLGKYVRHPLYFGIIILVTGLFLYLPTQMNLLSALITCAYIYIGARLEEKKLEEVFGEEYRTYMQRTKMLLPFLF